MPDTRASAPTGDGCERAVVLSGTGGVWQVMADSGERRDVSLRGRLKQGGKRAQKLAAGDVVTIEQDAPGSSWSITAIEPRRSQLTRRAPGGAVGERTVAANVDQVLVVFAAAKPEPHPRMLDRFLVIAEANGLLARVVINKVDLVGVESAQGVFAGYVTAGYPIHFTSTKQAIGLDELRASLTDMTSVLSGPSGVGKSSLINAMFPGLNLRVGEISESVNKGRHTTVGAYAHPLPGGGFVVDTPGLREIGMWGLPADGLDRCFPEMRPYIEQCRFGDCLHIVEPDCAVRAAVETGAISAARYDSYLRLYAEVDETDKQFGDSATLPPRRR